MTLIQLAAFAVSAILIGFIKNSKIRVRAILVSSALAIYWLQPASTIRYLEFWFPTITIALVLWVYGSCFPDTIRSKQNLIDVGLLLGTSIFVGLLRYFGPLCCLTSSTPPQILTIVGYIIIAMAIVVLLVAAKSKSVIYQALFVLILAVFLFLKNEQLAELASKWLRSITGQNTNLANSFDIIWLGYSYTAFRLLHILRDKQNNRLPELDFAEFTSFVIFFPSFTAGPIDRVQNFVKKLRENNLLNSPRFIQGTERLSIGIFKKFILADNLALMSLNAQNAGQINSTFWGWIALYAYSFRILLDFSGYTDIAIGIGIYAGIQLPENFNKPYLKPNLTEFWNNWHITLTQWFRAYYFNPLTRYFRSAKFKISVPAIIIIGQFSTMILIGLWHGISWNFVLWGTWHGAGLFIHNRWSAYLKNRDTKMNSVVTKTKWLKNFGILLNFHFVALGWIWFVLPTPVLGWHFFKILFGAF